MKKVNRFSMASSSSYSYSYPDGLEARYHCLMQDYMDLHKETEAKRKKLLKAKKKKLELLPIVKFLRGKLKSQRIQTRLQKQSLKVLPVSNVRSRVPLKDGQEIRDAPVPSAKTLLDLNQSIPHTCNSLFC